MSDDKVSQNLDDILNSLMVSVKNTQGNLNDINEKKTDALTDDELFKELIGFIMQNIQNNKEVLAESKDLAISIGDAELIEAYSTVSKSNADLLKTMAGILTERQKMKLQEKLKERDIEGKKEIIALKGENKQQLGDGNVKANIQNNFYLTATRDEMYDAIWGTDEQKDKAREKLEKQMKENNPPVIDV